MPITPEDLYLAAAMLNRLKPTLVSDEVCARTMAGRLYYAAYLATREAIRVQMGILAFDVSHTVLTTALRNSHDVEVRALGARLRVLKELREDADYRPRHHVSKVDAAFRLADARYVLDNVGRLTGRYPPMRRRRP